ncbi:MAG: hypothetical protein J1E37_06080 [Prevotella sp.]|nr:hypothetical protein [Prevotella sp.]
MDDASGTLAALNEAIHDAAKVKSRDDMNVGDIVYQTMDRNDGLTLNKGYDTRNKLFVIVGKKSNGEAVGTCLINSTFKGDAERQKFQYTIRKDKYPDVAVLTSDSPLDCSKLFRMNVRKSVAVKAEIVGHLTDEDKENIIQLVTSCGFVNNHDKKVFRIGID